MQDSEGQTALPAQGGTWVTCPQYYIFIYFNTEGAQIQDVFLLGEYFSSVVHQYEIRNWTPSPTEPVRQERIVPLMGPEAAAGPAAAVSFSATGDLTMSTQAPGVLLAESF